jgi:DNA polymerase-1
MVADLSQAELRYIAHFSKDPNLLKVFTEQGLDLHAITLAGLHKHWPEAQRTDAKIVLFSSMYGITPPRLAAKMHQSEEVAEQALASLWATYTGIPKLNSWCLKFVEQNGYMKTVLGFKRFLSNRIVKDRRTGELGLHWTVRNQCLSTLIQGSVADHIKVAGCRILSELRTKGLNERATIHAQEHDALLVSADLPVLEQVKDIVQHHMTTAVKMRVPMVSDVKFGDSWGAAK